MAEKIITNEKTLSPEEESYRNKSVKLWEAFSSLLSGNEMTLGDSSEPGFSGDAASLFTIARINKPDGTEVARPFKIGWGEFSANTFLKDLPDSNPNVTEKKGEVDQLRDHFQNKRNQRKRDLRSLGFPMYVVPQMAGYFDLMSPEKSKKFMDDPKDYFAEHTKLIFHQGSLIMQKPKMFRDMGGSENEKKIKNLPVYTFEEILADIRNKILERDHTPAYFASLLKLLPEDPDELEKLLKICYVEKGENVAPEELKKILGFEVEFSADELIKRQNVWHLLKFLPRLCPDNPYAFDWGGKHAVEAIQEIKKSFNFSTNKFE